MGKHRLWVVSIAASVSPARALFGRSRWKRSMIKPKRFMRNTGFFLSPGIPIIWPSRSKPSKRCLAREAGPSNGNEILMARTRRSREIIRQFPENGLKLLLENPGNVRDLLDITRPPEGQLIDFDRL